MICCLPLLSIQLSNNLHSPNPPQSVFEHFVEVYSIKLHLQPLPLFELECLRDMLPVAAGYLQYSFLTLMLEFSSHLYYTNRREEASTFYRHSAEAATQQLAGQGKPKAEIMQALCMLALRNIAGTDKVKAFKYLLTPI